MTTLTIISTVMLAYGLWRPQHFGLVLALGGATPTGAAFVAGDTAVPTFYFVALGSLGLLFAQLLQRTRQRQRLERPLTCGLLALITLCLWSIVVTFSAPLLFDGMTVYASGGVPNQLRAGVLTSSNEAQLVYLILSVAVVVVLSRGSGARTELIGLVSGLTMVLSFWSYLAINYGLPFPLNFFDNSPGFAYIDGAPGGVIRFRGIFSEPAGLAVACLVTMAYMTARLRRVQGLRRVGVIVVLAISTFLGSISTSTTFVVALVLLLALALMVALLEVVIARLPLSTLAIGGAGGVLGAAPFVIPIVVTSVAAVVTTKVGTSSYQDRSSADSDSYKIALETLGFGVGVGSNRPSSFFAALLSTVGVLGTVIFIGAVAVIITRVWRIPTTRPVVWALLAALVTKFISGPDLNDTSGLMWLSIGILAHAAAARDREEALVGPNRRQRENAQGRE